MSPEARARVSAAIDFNPGRSRVTIQREDARELLDDDGEAALRTLLREAKSKLCAQREEIEDLKAGLVATTDALGFEIDNAVQLRAQLHTQRTELRSLRGRPSWAELIGALALLPLSFASGWLVDATHLLTLHRG